MEVVALTQDLVVRCQAQPAELVPATAWASTSHMVAPSILFDTLVTTRAWFSDTGEVGRGSLVDVVQEHDREVIAGDTVMPRDIMREAGFETTLGACHDRGCSSTGMDLSRSAFCALAPSEIIVRLK